MHEGTDAPAHTEADSAIVVRSLSKTFPGQRALDGVNFAVARGEVHGLLGENGSGKSTLIKTLSGYHMPDPGADVRVNGEVLSFGSPGDASRLGLRFVHQNLGVVDQLTAIENVALTSGYAVGFGRRIKVRTQARRTQRLLDRLGVAVDLWRPLGECRAIDRTFVAIARALEDLDDDRGVLVLDEPTAALPPDEVAHLFSVLRELSRRGVTTIYVSHRLDEVFEICDRVTVLRDGLVQGTFATSELDRPALIRLIVGQDLPLDVHPPDAPSDPSVAQVPRLQVDGLSGASLHDISFTVGTGEILGVAGLLGSGRESLAYSLVGAVPATARSIRLDETPLPPLNPSRARRLGIALIPGDRRRGSAIGQFTVRENITLANLEQVRHRGRVSRSAEMRETERWITTLDLRPPEANKRFTLLSGGNQQKAILARWFATDPTIVLVDEPTAGVDVGARHVIYDRIRDYAAGGVSFLVCSSDFEDLVELCSRVIVLRDGHVAREIRGLDITMDSLLGATMEEEGPTDG